mmetsp:Transcript_29350/g.32608  ORF Transcript_29350/g.32608 Transcript_29350/m.32608 type:complete len:374 (-) Transcript_29350:91-1212(-)
MGSNISIEDEDKRFIKKKLLSTLEGFTKGFCVYFIPMCLLKRRVTGIRRGLALGAFVGGFRATDAIATFLKRKKQLPKKVSPRLQMAVNSAVSMALALAVDGELHTSSIIVNWFLVRSLRTISPDVPYGATIIMCISSAQILSTWLQAPDELHPSYLSFLNYQGGQSKHNMAILQSPGIKIKSPCHVTHPGMSHVRYLLYFWFQALRRAIPVYLPVYLIFFVLSKHKNRVQLVVSILRSSCFLATYCWLGWASGCMYYGASGTTYSRLNLFKHTWIAGLATLIDRPSKRKELAAYCLTYAIDSFYTYLRKRGHIGHPPSWVSGTILVLSIGLMMYHFDQQPGFLTKWLLNIDKYDIASQHEEHCSPRGLRNTT